MKKTQVTLAIMCMLPLWGCATSRMVTRFYPVERVILDGIATDSTYGILKPNADSLTPEDLKHFFEDASAPFPPGAWVRYDKKRGGLLFRNTPENHKIIEVLVRPLNATEPNKITGANHGQAATVAGEFVLCPRLPVVAQFRRWAEMESS